MIAMGALCENAISEAMQSLFSADKAAAQRTIEEDREIDQKEKDIEALCLRLLLQQQPVARDLRVISSALKMITDMERIGDQAATSRAHSPHAFDPGQPPKQAPFENGGRGQKNGDRKH